MTALPGYLVRYRYLLLASFVLVATLVSAAFAAGTPAGTVIRNQAEAAFERAGLTETALSNPVDTLITSICSLAITPNGSVAAPAHQRALEVGQSVLLPYTLTNTGNDVADFTLRVDLLAASTTSPSTTRIVWDQNGNGAADPGEPAITSVNALAPDASVALLVEATVALTAAAGEIYLAPVGSCTSDPGVLDDDNVAQLSVSLPQADLVVTKSDGRTVAYPGETLSYQIVVANQGPRDVAGATLDDVLDPAIFDVTAASWSCSVSNGSGSCAPASGSGDLASSVTLAAGSSLTVTVLAPIRGDAAGTARNTATVTLPPGLADPTPEDASGSDDTEVIALPEPTKSADPPSGSSLYPGAPITYTITFQASAFDLRDVVVTDLLDPALATPVQVTSGAITDPATGLGTTVTAAVTNTGNGELVTWQLGSVPATMTVTLEVVTFVRSDVAAGATIRNQACLGVTVSTVQRCSETTQHPVAAAQLALEKTASPSRVQVGDTLRYTLVGVNPSSATLRNLRLTDDLPSGLRYVAGSSVLTLGATVTPLEPTVSGRTLTWDALPDLPPGERFTITFDTTVLPGALRQDELVNNAEFAALDGNGDPVEAADDSAVTPVDAGVFEGRAVLTGVAFIDSDGNGLFDEARDPVVPGLRLYLSDGRTTLTDELGRYTFQNLEPSLAALRVDLTTAPARLFAPTPGEEHAGFWRLRLEPGVITRQDIPFVPPEVRVAVRQELQVAMGPLHLVKTATAQPDGSSLVELAIRSGSALQGLELREQLPADATVLRAPATASGEAVAGASVSEGQLLLPLGDVPAGFTITIRYALVSAAPLPALLTAPRIRWEVR